MAAATAPAEANDRQEGRRAGSSTVVRILLYVVLVLIALFFLLPLLWMLSTSLKPRSEWITLPLTWIPYNPTLENYTAILANPTLPIARWFVNSLSIAAIVTILVVVFDSMAGYAYARMEFPGRDILFGLLLATLFLPGMMFLVPNFLTIAALGWLNTYQGVFVPGLAGVFGVFFLRQFFQSIPRELEEAAFIDGAGPFTTFFRVVMPLARPAMATLGIITFLGSWNDFLWPLLIMSERQMKTLPVGLAELQGAYVFEYGPLMAGAVIAAVPVLILYLFLQRYIVQSVAMTGLKG
ncbi:MAG: carbohydrate ABC transporter permease [Anaerolineae bacterium]